MYYENDNIGYKTFIVVSQNEYGEINWIKRLDPLRPADNRTIYDIEQAEDGNILLLSLIHI